jgi:hypothetical protein
MPPSVKQVPRGMALRAIAHTGAVLVYEVPRDVNTRAEIETNYVPVAVREPGRQWRAFTPRSAKWEMGEVTSKPRYSKKRLDAVKLASEENPAPAATVRVIFSVPQKAWRNLVAAVVRDEVTKIAGKPRPGDEDAEVATVEWRRSSASRSRRDCCGMCSGARASVCRNDLRRRSEMSDDQKITAIERLETLLDERDEKIHALTEELAEAKEILDSKRWERHRKGEDNGLPVPRLEFAWIPSPDAGWMDFTVEYRLVMKHLLDYDVIVPLGSTRTRGGNDTDPRTREGGVARCLPFRDGAHAHHDAAHLGLPLYAIGPDGPIRVDGDGYTSQRARGEQHRRIAPVTQLADGDFRAEGL